jgi:hypothetical protein
VIAADPRAARPGVALRPVARTGDLRCRMLGIDTEEAGDADEQLLRRFSPRFVNLPGITEDAGKPYPDGTNDYQPSAVETYLDDVTTVRQAPRGLLGWANIAYTGLSYVLLAAPALMALVGAAGDVVAGVAVVGVLNAAVATIVIVPGYRWFRTPVNAQELSARIAGPGWGGSYAMTAFKVNRIPSPEAAWAQYRDAIGKPRPPEQQGNVVYARVQPVEDARVAKVLQYWLFYYYNDWWNTHEADWEVAMVYLDSADQPVAAACSSHLSGTWRPWGALDLGTDGGSHPTIYIARGSHAMYFNVAGGIHYAVLRQPWAIFDFSGQLLVKGSKDAVGHAVLPTDTYRLAVIPPGVERPSDDNRKTWPQWWWLSFEGRWGQRDGILSPFVQEDHLRWSQPIEWARDHCAPESVSWAEATGTPEQATAEAGP